MNSSSLAEPTGSRNRTACLAEGIYLLNLKPIQYQFPLTAFGLILEGTFGPAVAAS